ncbi:hypothetical protein ACFSQQ_35525 [Mesorhizobium kowhaii]|uniref:hypothetical protein n=1 Tax=Mesorhizobium kowhaii TaxID=1300272 RepID=UPI0035E8C4E1
MANPDKGQLKRLGKGGISTAIFTTFGSVGKRSGCKILHCKRKGFTASRFLVMLASHLQHTRRANRFFESFWETVR